MPLFGKPWSIFLRTGDPPPEKARVALGALAVATVAWLVVARFYQVNTRTKELVAT